MIDYAYFVTAGLIASELGATKESQIVISRLPPYTPVLVTAEVGHTLFESLTQDDRVTPEEHRHANGRSVFLGYSVKCDTVVVALPPNK